MIEVVTWPVIRALESLNLVTCLSMENLMLRQLLAFLNAPTAFPEAKFLGVT